MNSNTLATKKDCLSPTESSPSSRSKTVTLCKFSYYFRHPHAWNHTCKAPHCASHMDNHTINSKKSQSFCIFCRLYPVHMKALSQFYLQLHQNRLCHAHTFSCMKVFMKTIFVIHIFWKTAHTFLIAAVIRAIRPICTVIRQVKESLPWNFRKNFQIIWLI